MADERQLNVTTRLDASGIRAGMDAAAQVVKQGSDQMAASFATAAEASAALKRAQGDMASILKAVGGTINENNAAWGLYSAAQKEAADATAALAAMQREAAASAAALSSADAVLASAETATAHATEAHASSLASLRPRLSANSSGLRANISGTQSLGAFAAIAGAALTVHLADGAAKAAVALDDLSQATGVSVAQLAGLQAAFAESGIADKAFQGALSHLLEQQQQLANGSKEAASAFLQLGIPLGAVQDGSLSLVQVLDAISAKLHDAGSSTSDLTSAEYLLGSSQLDLIGVLRQGPDAIQELAQKYAALGDQTAESVSDARGLTAAEGELKAAFDGLALRTIPAVTGAVDLLSHPLVAVRALLEGGASMAGNFAAELAALQTEAAGWSGGASIFGGPASAHQAQIKAELDLVGLVETADAVGKNHLATIEAHRDAIRQLADELGTAAVPALQRYNNELGKAADEAATKATAALTRAAKANAEAETRLGDVARAQHIEAEGVALSEAEAGAGRAARAVAESVRQQAADAKAAASEVFSQQQRDIAASAQLAIGAIQIRARAHDINAQQEQAQMEAVYRSEYDAQVAALKAELAALRESDKNYFAEKQRLFNEIDDAYNRLQANLQRSQAAPGAAKTPIPLDAQIAAKGITTMANDFSRMMDGVMTGTQRLSVAWRRMGAEMVAGWAAAMIQMAAKHLAMEITTTAQHAAAKQAQVAINASAASQSTSIDAVRSLKEITHSAGVAAAKAWSAVVGIPVIGPILAPPAAAASYAGVMAFGALTSAEGGQWRVPAAEQLTMLHRNEMVLPAVHAEALRQTVAGGGGGNTMHFHFAPTIHAVDADGVEAMLRNHAPKFAGAVQRHLRTKNAG